MKGTPQVLMEAVAMPAVKTGETQKSEETPHEAAASPSVQAQAIFIVEGIARKPELLQRPLRRLPRR
jgi:hypothetical protein